MYKLVLALIVLSCVYTANASTCATTGCPSNQACYGAAGSAPSCYTFGNCGIVPCPSGQSCLVINGSAHCVAASICPTCPSNSACYQFPGTSAPDCYTYTNCGIVPCPAGQSCLSTPTGGHACVAAF
ncbi:hypothetical protein SAMD00019534_050880 [Acytostelium subglobosum LB1]|uniref:hypothetical protein n=1 Tax=Acytostelium subglobosum LB1 TaxID=1410327 RepID=UPI000644E219|nr:hypothetical protein SAMD00019534_050880 [Acytostelium subglobosum LB1]GAM21913.1 hypothetical protein SAMD00019534_050880 [Acytostelium subglobosum LB1]|eukprot:XP_012755013.1 hypothetical protein SAMD00019534_050880 [Acytostelium subglobosum LB1]